MDFNEERLAFYYEIGLSITQWAHIEFALAWIVGSCFDGKNKDIAGMGFFSIENFRAKLQYADSIVSQRELSKLEKTLWTALVDRAVQASKKRNKLAHSWVMNDTTMRAGRRVMLLSTRSTAKKGRQKWPGSVCVRDVAGYRLEFAALMRDLENFQCRLDGRGARFPESLEQPKAPPTLDQIRREIYAYVSHPPPPSRP